MSSVNIDGHKIRTLREQQELTQLYLATVVGVTTDTISRWENRRYPTIKLENARKLADALQVEMEELLEPEASATEPGVEEGPPETPALQKHRMVISRGRVIAAALTILILAIVAAGALRLLGPPSPASIQATRIVPPHAAPGMPFPVRIEITAAAGIDAAVLVREEVSGNGLASGITGEHREYGNNPRWIGTLDQGRATFLYLVRPEPAPQVDAAITFDGRLALKDGPADSIPIDGTGSVQVAPFHWADTDQDNRISDEEILAAFETYAGSGDNPLDFDDLEELWLSGGYSWNQDALSFTLAGHDALTLEDQ